MKLGYWLLVILLAGVAVGIRVSCDKRPVMYGAVSVCEISYYSAPEHGRPTACGEIFDSTKLSCATQVDSIRPGENVLFVNGTDSVVCRVNDRMPNVYKRTHPGRLFDLSRAAFESLGVHVRAGVVDVQWRKF